MLEGLENRTRHDAKTVPRLLLVLLTCWLPNQLWEAGTRPNRATRLAVNARHRQNQHHQTGYNDRLCFAEEPALAFGGPVVAMSNIIIVVVERVHPVPTNERTVSHVRSFAPAR